MFSYYNLKYETTALTWANSQSTNGVRHERREEV